jgi:transcriptional regulator with PAS, ATPase and Fis domain
MKDLQTMTLADLRQKAKELAVKGWWTLKKTDLIKAIENASVVQEEVEVEVNANTLVEEENVSEVKSEAQEVNQKKNQKRLIEYKGKTQTLTAWAKELGIRHQTLYNRIVMKGMDPNEAFEKPLKKANKEVIEA